MNHFIMKILKNLIVILAILGAGQALTAQTVKQTKSDPNVPLFEVKNDLGQTVFAVYPGGVHIFIDDTPAKAAGGGFSVGRLSTGKATADDFFTVNPGDVRVIIPSTTAKAAGGGFSVGRLSTGKASGDTINYLRVTPDSTRIYVNDSIKGFAVSNIQEGANQNFMNLNKQNYLIGHQTGFKLTTGIYNSMLGYQAGYNSTAGSNNLFLGYKSGYSNAGGGNNVYIGTEAGYSSQNTYQNTFVGYRGGYSLTGASNTVLGSMAGENASGGNNTFIGTSAGRLAVGGNNTFVGEGAGYAFPNENSGVRNTYIGQKAGAFTSTGNYNVMIGFNAGYLNYEGSNNTFLGYDAGHNVHAGSGNVFIGHEAGYNVNNVSNKLYIDNSNTSSPLIYGEFDNHRVVINGNNTDNTLNYTFYVNGRGGGSYSWNSLSDGRLKANIVTIPNALQKVMELRGVNFNWKDESYEKGIQIGFIAQEVQKILPEVVDYNNDRYSMQYAPITALLVEAMKEQQEQINKLTEENQSLKDQVSEFKKLKDDIEFLKKQFKEEKKKN